MGSMRVVDGLKSEALVESAGAGIHGAQAHLFEILLGASQQGGYQVSPDAEISPGCADVDAANSSHRRIAEKRVAVEAADSHQRVFVEDAEKCLSGSVETVGTGLPLVDKPVEELEILGGSLVGHRLQAGDREYDGADRDHRNTVLGRQGRCNAAVSIRIRSL